VAGGGAELLDLGVDLVEGDRGGPLPAGMPSASSWSSRSGWSPSVTTRSGSNAAIASTFGAKPLSPCIFSAPRAGGSRSRRRRPPGRRPRSRRASRCGWATARRSPRDVTGRRRPPVRSTVPRSAGGRLAVVLGLGSRIVGGVVAAGGGRQREADDDAATDLVRLIRMDLPPHREDKWVDHRVTGLRTALASRVWCRAAGRRPDSSRLDVRTNRGRIEPPLRDSAGISPDFAVPCSPHVHGTRPLRTLPATLVG
jgi:hypothetical protein